MGYNFSCIAIDKNINGQVDAFLENNNIFIAPTGKRVSIDRAMNGDQSKEIDAFFTDRGTILFIPYDLSLQAYKFGGANVMAFSYYETVMAFTIFFTEDGKLVRTILEAEGEIHDQSGEPLSIESDHESIADCIEEMVEYLTGFRLFSYDEESTCERYSIEPQKKRKGFFARLFSK